MVEERKVTIECSPITVSELLDETNKKLASAECRVQGEIGRVQARGTYLFFSLKDMGDESTVNCFCWASVVRTCGLDIKEGAEVIITGHLSVYKRTGNLTFQVLVIEVVGEGALKKAFEALKQKLETEGLFASDIKKAIPEFPRCIALITSKHGEAINDFTTNIGQFGFCISFKDCRVEGQRAVFDLVKAIEFFNKRPDRFDALVLIRGGGSWESLQAFNNEAVARAICESDIPVICGVGHEGDVTIADLVADFRASTPTAAAKKISECWAKSREQVTICGNVIKDRMNFSLLKKSERIGRDANVIKGEFARIMDSYRRLEARLKSGIEKAGYYLKDRNRLLSESWLAIHDGSATLLRRSADLVSVLAGRIESGNPLRQLRLGYSIARKGGKIIRSVKDIQSGDSMDIKFSDGEVETEVRNLKFKI